jgi:hypothetical protein
MPVTGYSGPTQGWQAARLRPDTSPPRAAFPTAPGRESDLREADALRDEYGRLRQPTIMAGAAPGTQGLHSGGHNHMQRSRGLHSMAGTLINPAVTIYARPDRPAQPGSSGGASNNTAVSHTLSTDETTLPGDLLVRKSGLPIASRMAALIRQRSLDVASLISDYLRRAAFSKMPQRAHNFIDIATFKRALCYAFAEQWQQLGMTTPEFMEVYSPYIVREQTKDGDALINWKAFSSDISS